MILCNICKIRETRSGSWQNVFELQKAMIAAGVAGTHWQDQLASEKKCGHQGAKVLIPTGQHIRTLTSARLAAGVCDAPTVVIARTDAESATLLISNVYERDQPFVTGERSKEGFYRMSGGLQPCIARARAYAPYADPIGMETGTPTSSWPRSSPRVSRPSSPTRCWPTTARRRSTGANASTTRPSPSSKKSWAPWDSSSSSARWRASPPLNYSMFDLACGYARNQMSAYVELQEREFAAEERWYTATKHQREVGAG